MTTTPHMTTTSHPSDAPALSRRALLAGLGSSAALVALGGCDTGSSDSTTVAYVEPTFAEPTGELAIDMTAWNHDDDNDVWWQVGLAYCTSPQLADYETLGIYVPGAYLTGTQNDDGETWTCELAADGEAGDFTAATAPIVIPVNTAGYAAQAAPTSYSYDSVSAYLEAGFVYAYPGCRGRDNGESDDGEVTYAGGAPWGVTDLKAAIRWLRYNQALLPGDTASIFTFGHSGGGAQSSLVGATGGSALYETYLADIGAAMEDSAGTEISDVTCGAMCWCPITCLDEADAAYEWQMGQFASSGTREDGTFTAQLSADLADAFASRINEMGLTKDGEELTLEESDEGHYLAGTYADAVVATIEESLSNFIDDTEFPYTPSSSEMADGGFGGGLTGGGASDATGELPDGDVSDGELPDGDVSQGELPEGGPTGDTSGDSSGGDSSNSSGPSGAGPSGGAPVDGDAPEDTQGDVTQMSEDGPEGAPTGDASGDAADGDPTGDASGGLPGGDSTDGTAGGDSAGDSTDSSESSETTYETADDYIASLNTDEEWVTYDESSGVSISGLGAFARVVKAPTKDVGAFDDLSLSQAENKVFTDGTDEGCHFDPIMADLLSENADAYAELENWDDSYPDAYAEGLEKTDALGLTVRDRCDMYNPMYFLLESSEGYASSIPAPHWRIRTGITQGDTALTTEMNLALALESADGVEDVDFATVWGQGHTTAEREGSSDDNFIEWVKSCLG